jgi:hypothetical protein
VLLADASQAQLRRAVADRSGDSPSVHVIAPTHVGPLEWLATDEDEARREADIRALEAEWTLGDQADVEGEAGDVDPVQPVEDALRTFPANEILTVGSAAENGGLEASLRRFESSGRVGGRRLAPCGVGRLALVSSRPPSNRA